MSSRKVSAQEIAHGDAQLATPPSLRLFNTLTRQVEEIVPIEPGHVRMYSCGPTVYRFIHIGNLRTFTMADWIRRALVAQGMRVTHIKNITDVGHMRQELLDRGEDKMIAQARQEGKSPYAIAAFYTEAFHNDETRLNILPAHVFPRATDHIPEMIAITERLLERGFAYESGGNVFFSVKAFPAYGQLSGNLLENLGQGEHIANENDPQKRAPEDFPLWKVAEPGRLMAWDSPWGRGFPGWHVECSAMSAKYLGPQFDLHTGGVDNIFPHHEDERAQSEGASGEQFVHYWVHGQHLLADGLKMAKSTGNAYTLADVEARGFEPLALRYFFTTARYRSRINFTFRALRASQTALHRLREHAYRLYERSIEDGETGDGSSSARQAAKAAPNGRQSPPPRAGEPSVSATSLAHPYYRAFLAAVDADLNIPVAMAVIWRMLRDETLTPALRLELLYAADDILGFNFAADVATYAEQTPDARRAGDAPKAVVALAKKRATARAKHNWSAADNLREQIAQAGYEVRDIGYAPEDWRLTRREEQETFISGSVDVASCLDEPDRHAFSVNLLAHNSRDDLQRCIESVAHHAGGRDIELVIIDNGSTDDTLAYLRQIAHAGAVDGLPVRIYFADHDMGFAAGRNASFRASLGRIVVQMDTSIEVNGDIWTPIEQLLADPTIGLVGPYGLVTTDLKEFEESAGPDVDAIEGYLMAFRREELREVGPADEKFRFYRLMDIDYSFEFKKAGYRAVASAEVAERLFKHPHREWYALSPDEQGTRSKKNFDIFRRRRHHCENLLVANFTRGQAAPWGHDHEIADADLIAPRFEHGPVAASTVHSHEHKHWSDHSHTHPHTHAPSPQWFGDGAPSRYVPSFTAPESDDASQ